MASLLDVTAVYDQSVSLKFLSADTGLHPATTHLILSSLTVQGFVQRNETGCYRLGHEFIELDTMHANARFDIS